jgi:hypothetical protein
VVAWLLLRCVQSGRERKFYNFSSTGEERLAFRQLFLWLKTRGIDRSSCSVDRRGAHGANLFNAYSGVIIMDILNAYTRTINIFSVYRSDIFNVDCRGACVIIRGLRVNVFNVYRGSLIDGDRADVLNGRGGRRASDRRWLSAWLFLSCFLSPLNVKAKVGVFL